MQEANMHLFSNIQAALRILCMFVMITEPCLQIAAKRHMELLPGDQLLREMKRGIIFHGLTEGRISFMPTYKFEKGRESNALQPFYDQGEKKRVPAWTDRIFFRGCLPPGGQPHDVKVALSGAQGYNSCMDISDSDHKPVYAELNVVLPAYQQDRKRQVSFEALHHMAAECQGVGETLQLQPNQLSLGDGQIESVRVTNPSNHALSYAVACTGGDGAGCLLPHWLEALPSRGVIPARGVAIIEIRGSEGLHWSKGKQTTVLQVNVDAAGGSLQSTGVQQRTKGLQVHVSFE